MKRLVIAPNWIGDCVMALPFLRALKRNDPGGELALSCLASAAPIFRIEPSVSEVCVRRGRSAVELLRHALELRGHHFGEAWVLPHSLRAALIAFLSRAPVRVGFDTDRRGFLLTEIVPRPVTPGHQLRDDDPLLDARGISPDLDPPRIAIPENLFRKTSDRLALDGFAAGEKFVALLPGAAFGETKRWPAERFALLADALMDEGWKAAIFIGPAEVDLGRLIARRARHRIPVLGAELDAGELAANLARAALFVGNDSGPAHLAAAVGTPGVVFFGPTDPARTAPVGSEIVVMDRYVFCSPCFLKVCPYGHECMEEISVEAVATAVRRIRDKTKGPAEAGP